MEAAKSMPVTPNVEYSLKVLHDSIKSIPAEETRQNADRALQYLMKLAEGGEAQAPMARVVIGGLLSSTFITLIFVPVVYSIFERRGFNAKSSSSGGM